MYVSTVTTERLPFFFCSPLTNGSNSIKIGTIGETGDETN